MKLKKRKKKERLTEVSFYVGSWSSSIKKKKKKKKSTSEGLRNTAVSAAIMCLAFRVTCMNKVDMCDRGVCYLMSQPFSTLHW